ncbi:MAG: HepT-like ribonuclease domain-containing protein [Acidimicrobiales bacterium]
MISGPSDGRSVDKVLGDIADAVGAAAEIVGRGRAAWDHDRLIRLAGEAVINRIGEATTRLPAEITRALPGVPWADIRANRVLVAHIYHRIDYSELWSTLARDVPELGRQLERWREPDREHRVERETGRSSDRGLGMDF